MDLLTIIGLLAVLAAAVLLIWMKRYYAVETERLREEVKLFKNTNEYQHESVVVFSENFTLLSANRAARKLLQLEPFTVDMTPEKEIFLQVGHSDQMSLFDIIKKQSATTKGTIRLDKVWMTIGDKKSYINLFIDHSKWNMKNSIVCVFQDESSEAKKEVGSGQSGEIDFLTNLPSQFKANSDINQLVVGAQKDSNKLALLIFGIKDFDKMKATFGLGYTNNLLKKFAEFLNDLDYKDTSSYRLDCDNFLFIIKDIEREEKAVDRALAINKKISIFFKLKNKNMNVSFSTGIVLFPDHGRNASKLIDSAYAALEESKLKTDGQIKIYNKKANHIKKEEKIMIDEMREALESGDFEVYYQPIIDLRSTDIYGAEALVRWNHPILGILTPDKFIGLAELSGLIVDIGEFVLSEVITQQKHWSQSGFNNIEISINISARELLVYQLGDKLEQLFLEHKVDPSFFNLDMSESDAMEDTIKTDYEFSILKKMGVHLSLDHFGVGGSSIEQLQKLPIHTLKVDRSLLKDIDTDPNHQETFKAIVVLAHALGIDVVAEGIERNEQYATLQKLGCDRAQGYIFSRPEPASEFQKLLKKS